MAVTKTVKVQVDTGNSVQQLGSVKEGFEGIDAGAKEAATGTSVLTLGVRTLGLALKSAGIGIVISLFVGLGNALMQNQFVMDKFNVALEMFNLTFKRMISFVTESYNVFLANDEQMALFSRRFENLGNIMNNTLNFALNNFNMGMKTATVLWNASPFGDGSTSLDDLKNLGSEMVDFAQTQQGLLKDQLGEIEIFVEDQIKGAGITFDFYTERWGALAEEFVTGENNIYATADAIVSLRNEVKLAEANQRQLQLTYQRDAELQRQIRDDVSLTIEERMAANKRLGEILDEQTQVERAAMLKSLELAQVELDQDKTNVDLQVASINAKTEIIDLDERIAGQRSEQLTNTNSLIKEQADLEKALAQQKSDALKEEDRKAKEKADAQFANMNKQVDMTQKMFASIGAIRSEQFVKEQNELDKQLKKGLITQEEYDKESRKIEKQALKAEKRNAKFQILIDTAQGIAGAIKAGAGLAFPANLGAIASGVASVLAGIASAKAVLNQVPGGGGEGGDATEGAVSSVMGGIGNVVPNIQAITGDEADTTPIQAFVVENDISDAQALQEELDIQATL